MQEKFDTKAMSLYNPDQKQLKEIFMHLDQSKLNEALKEGDHLKTIDEFFKRPKDEIIEELSNFAGTSRNYGKDADHDIYRGLDMKKGIIPDYQITHAKIRQILRQLFQRDMRNQSTETLEFIVKGLRHIVRRDFNTLFEYRCNKCFYPASTHPLVQICKPDKHIIDEGRYKYSLGNEISNYVRIINNKDGDKAHKELHQRTNEIVNNDTRYEELFKESQRNHEQQLKEFKKVTTLEYKEKLENDRTKLKAEMADEMQRVRKIMEDGVESHKIKSQDLEKQNQILDARAKSLMHENDELKTELKKETDDKDRYEKKWSKALEQQQKLENERKEWQVERAQLMKENREMHNKYRADNEEMQLLEEKITRILQRDTTPNNADSEEVRELKQKIVILQDKYERIGQGNTINPKDIRKEVYFANHDIAFKGIMKAIKNIEKETEKDNNRCISNALEDCNIYLNDIKKAQCFLYINDRIQQNKQRTSDERIDNFKENFHEFLEIARKINDEDLTLEEAIQYIRQVKTYIHDAIEADKESEEKEKESRNKSAKKLPKGYKTPKQNNGQNKTSQDDKQNKNDSASRRKDKNKNSAKGRKKKSRSRSSSPNQPATDHGESSKSNETGSAEVPDKVQRQEEREDDDNPPSSGINSSESSAPGDMDNKDEEINTRRNKRQRESSGSDSEPHLMIDKSTTDGAKTK